MFVNPIIPSISVHTNNNLCVIHGDVNIVTVKKAEKCIGQNVMNTPMKIIVRIL